MSEFDSIKRNVGIFIQRYVDTVRETIADPSAFFIRKADERGYIEPTLFVVVSFLLSKLFYGFLLAPITFGISLVLVLPSVVYKVGILFISSILMYGLIRVCGGRGDFETAYRSAAYASVSSLLLIIPIPVINLMLSTAGFGYILYFALRESHGLSQQQSFMILLVPVLFILIVGVALTLFSLIFAVKGLLMIFQLWI